MAMENDFVCLTSDSSTTIYSEKSFHDVFLQLQLLLIFSAVHVLHRKLFYNSLNNAKSLLNNKNIVSIIKPEISLFCNCQTVMQYLLQLPRHVHIDGGVQCSTRSCVASDSSRSGGGLVIVTTTQLLILFQISNSLSSLKNETR